MADRGTSTARDARTIAVVIPVLNRPHRTQLVADSLLESDPHGLCRLVFVCTPGDLEQIQACYATGCDTIVVGWPSGPGDYARKINDAAWITAEPWVFAGADDLRFHHGWAEAAIEAGELHGAGMVGTDDLGNGLVRQGRHSTHSLFRRSYIDECGTVDEPGLVYHEGYGHQHCDTEAYETAVARGCFAFAHASKVEHLHPFWGKGDRDATYEKGLASSDADLRLFEQRRHLWKAAAA